MVKAVLITHSFSKTITDDPDLAKVFPDITVIKGI